MTQIFKNDGRVVPVTLVQAGPCYVTEIKPGAVQIGFDESIKSLKKPQAGHLKDLPKLRFLREFDLRSEKEIKLKRGERLTVNIFKSGDQVEVTGISKGKGFQGVVKRHGFAGGPASHGHKDNLRLPGSIGAGGVQRVMKGHRMAGRMGGDQVTIKNLEIVEVDSANNLLKIKGALPGGRNALVIIKGPGEMAVEQAKAEEGTKNKEQGTSK